jgi:protein gp37
MANLIPQLFQNFFTEEHYVADNVWLGVTAENQEAADERIPWLLKTPAAVRFVSVEPMLGKIDLRIPVYEPGELPELHPSYIPIAVDVLDWVICGGETGPGAREMKASWAFGLYQQCREAEVPFFFKKPGDAFAGHVQNLPTTIRQWPEVK